MEGLPDLRHCSYQLALPCVYMNSMWGADGSVPLPNSPWTLDLHPFPAFAPEVPARRGRRRSSIAPVIWQYSDNGSTAPHLLQRFVHWPLVLALAMEARVRLASDGSCPACLLHAHSLQIMSNPTNTRRSPAAPDRRSMHNGLPYQPQSLRPFRLSAS